MRMPKQTLKSELDQIPVWLNNRWARRARASVLRRMKRRDVKHK